MWPKAKKTPKTQNLAREAKKGGKGFLKLRKLVTRSTYIVRKVAKVFSVGYDLLWSTFMVFIEDRCTLSKMDMYDSDFKKMLINILYVLRKCFAVIVLVFYFSLQAHLNNCLVWDACFHLCGIWWIIQFTWHI